jgi:membrane associated rhomboid family serine protease
VPAAVGVQCVECARANPQRAPLSSALGAPLRDGKPIVTISLIAACVVVYLLQQMIGGGGAVGDAIGSITRQLMPGSVVEQKLALVPLAVADEPWRLVTAAFLHTGLPHLAMNMYALWVVGSFLEDMMGRWRLAALFFASAIGGSVAVVAWAAHTGDLAEWLTPTMGASGGVFGLFAAMLWVVRRVGGNASGILAVILLNVVFSFTVASVSWQGHMGGLAVGAALGAVYAFAPRAQRTLYGVLGTVGAGAVLAALAAWVIGQVPPL